MACRFAKVSEEEIEEAFFYLSDLVNTKTVIPLRVGEERWIYTSTLRFAGQVQTESSNLSRLRVSLQEIDTLFATEIQIGSLFSQEEEFHRCFSP